jgi:hypothetical protein
MVSYITFVCVIFVDIIICVLFVGRGQSMSCDNFLCPIAVLFAKLSLILIQYLVMLYAHSNMGRHILHRAKVLSFVSGK